MKKFWKFLSAVCTVLGLFVFIPVCVLAVVICILAVIVLLGGFIFMLPGFGFYLLFDRKKSIPKTKISLDLLNEFPWWGLEEDDNK